MRRPARRALTVSCLLLLLLVAGTAVISWLTLAGVAMESSRGLWDENILDYFWNKGLIKTRDGLEINWEHAVNSRDKLNQALEEARIPGTFITFNSS